MLLVSSDHGNILAFTARLATEQRKTSDQYAAEIKNMLSDMVEKQREEKRVVGREYMIEEDCDDIL